MRRSFMAQVSKGLIPRPKEFVAVLFGDVRDFIGFVTVKPLNEGKFEWVEPEFGSAIVALNVDVRRLKPVGHVKEES